MVCPSCKKNHWSSPKMVCLSINVAGSLILYMFLKQRIPLKSRPLMQRWDEYLQNKEIQRNTYWWDTNAFSWDLVSTSIKIIWLGEGETRLELIFQKRSYELKNYGESHIDFSSIGVDIAMLFSKNYSIHLSVTGVCGSVWLTARRAQVGWVTARRIG